MSTQKQIDFLQILARPVLYNYPDFNKPNYNASRPYCDRCGTNLTNFYSSKATPNTDLCSGCFNALKNDDSTLVISGPINIQHHTTPAPIGHPTICPQPQTMSGARSQYFSVNDANDGPSSGEK